jgi:hypothetical protein
MILAKDYRVIQITKDSHLIDHLLNFLPSEEVEDIDVNKVAISLDKKYLTIHAHLLDDDESTD